MPFITNPEEALLGRLRAAAPATPLKAKNQANGVASHDELSLDEQLLHLLLHARTSPLVEGALTDHERILELLRRVTQHSTSNAVAAPQTGTETRVQGQSPAANASAGRPMHLTALGSAIVSDTDEPVASVNKKAHIPSAADVQGSADPHAAVAAASITTVDAEAPSNKPHAPLWKQVLEAGRTDKPIILNGRVVDSPALISVDSNNQLVHVPLRRAVNATSTSIPMAADITPVAVPRLQPSLLMAMPQASSTVAVPNILLRDNLAVSGASTVPPGFVLADKIMLFGGKIEAQRYTFHGTAAGDDEKAQLAILSQSPVNLSDITQTSGFSLGDLELQHPTVEVFSKPTSTGKDMGLYLDASVGLSGPLTDAGSTLKDIFAKDFGSVDISIRLGGYQGLGDAIKPPNDVTITAELPNVSIKLGGFVELKTATLSVHGTKAATGYTWSAGLGGTALVTVPGSVAPIEVTYAISKAQATYSFVLNLKQKEWTTAMGVPGLNLTDVKLSSSFTKATQNSVFSFDIDANIALGGTDVKVTGHYSKDGWDFHATVGDFTLQKLETTFATLFKTPLVPSSHDVVFTGLALDVNSKEKTFSLVGGVTVDTYTSASASLTLNSTGIVLKGDVAKAVFDMVTLDQAHLTLAITKQGVVDTTHPATGAAVSFTINGRLTIKSTITVDAEVLLIKSSNAGLAWVVYAKASGDLSLKRFVSEIPQDLDFALRNVVAIASNTSDASLFPPHVYDYTPKRGFQLRAELDCPEHLAKMMHTPPVALTLELDLGGQQNEVSFDFAAEQTLTLKPGMVSPSVKAGIMLSTPPQLFVEGDMKVQLSGQPQPLDFALRIQAGPTEAQGSVALNSDWNNPFNISKQVTVLAPVTLGVLIDYAAVTYPSGLSFQGGIQVGATKLQAAFEVGQNPQDGVLLVHAQNLGLRDIVSFTSQVIEHDLPLPPADLLYFKDLYLGISTGGTIGAVFYPPGATFNADMLIFGKALKVHCAIDKSLPGMKIAAELDTFQLGPVTVSGMAGKNPMLDLEFGTKLQQLAIDGKIALFDSDIATNVKVLMSPPSVTFDAELKFSDLLMFKVDAHAAGTITSIKDVVKADFSIYALFEQKLLDYMAATANTYIATAKKAADEGLDSAKAKLDQAQQAFDNKLNAAQRDVDHARLIWEAKSKSVTDSVNAQKQQLQADEAAKRAAVDNAEKAFNAKIAQLTANLQTAKNNAAASINNAQQNLTKATNDATSNINNAKQTLTNATNDMNNRFGDAVRKVNDAKANVASAQSTVDSLQRQVDQDNNDIHHGSWGDRIKGAARISADEAALLGAKGGLATAQGVLNLANSVITGVGYQAAQAAISAAQGSLDAANATARASISTAQESLRAANAAAQASVGAAQSALDTAKTACQELNVWNAAKATLAAFLKTEQAALDAANALVTGLATCAEKVAFDGATAALGAAKAATKELDAAKSVLNEVKGAVDEFASFGKWLVNHANIFNVRKVEISGSLNDAANKKPFMAHVVGSFADKEVDFHVEFTPGTAEAWVKNMVMGWVNEAKGDITKFIHL